MRFSLWASEALSDFLVLGGGLAGLTFALEVARRGRRAVVLESEEQVGGLARTLSFGEYRFDLGGHRYHSEWPEVTAWVLDVLGGEVLEVNRRSRIYLGGRYVDYPLRLPNAVAVFPMAGALRILASYLGARLRRDRRPADISFEDWVVRRFGRALYEIYFRPYTEKVWGIPCRELSADWAQQRIGLPGLDAAVLGSLRRRRPKTLISRFLYPPRGIGVLPERIAQKARATGRVTIHTRCPLLRLLPDPDAGWRAVCGQAGREQTFAGRQVVSTIPLDSLLRALPLPPALVSDLCRSLAYRGLRCVFLAVDGPRVSPDHWTYFPDPHLTLGRTHEPRNWSPQMAPPGQTSLGVEVFCSPGEPLWECSDDDLAEAIVDELDRVRFLPRSRVRAVWGARIPDAYPVYRIGYADELRRVHQALARWPTLHLAGRTGSFQYLNMDAVIRQAILLADSLCPGG